MWSDTRVWARNGAKMSGVYFEVFGRILQPFGAGV